MNKLTHLAAAIGLGAACALPVLAQDTGTTGATHGNTAAEAAPTTPLAGATAAPGISHTISASDTGSAGAPSTNTMGAGPEDMNRAGADGHRDIGWMGLLGLLGLLGLRRRQHHADDRMDMPHGNAR